MRAIRPTILVGIAGTILAALVFLPRLAAEDWNVSLYTAFGEEHIPIRQYAEARLESPYMRPLEGHDGKYFFVQANDPWMLDPATHASVIDDPQYRYQRMLYPTLVGLGGLLSPEVIIYTMFIVNLLAAGIGAWVVAELAVQMGGSPWWGLAFPLNVGFISEVAVGGSGVLAGAAAFGAVLAVTRRRFLLVAGLFVLASLSRETMLIAAAGCAWWVWKHGERRHSAVVAFAPLAVVGAWAVYVRARLGWDVEAEVVDRLGLPFVGFVASFGEWLGDPIRLVAGVAIMILLVLFVKHVVQTDSVVGWTFVGFAFLAIVLTDAVWLRFFDSSRAVAPAITAFLLLAFMRTDSARHDSDAVLELDESTPKGDSARSR